MIDKRDLTRRLVIFFPAAVLGLIALLGCTGSHAEGMRPPPHVLTVDDTQRLEAFGGFQLSPDEGSVAVEKLRPLGTSREPIFLPIFRNDLRVLLLSTDGRTRQEITTPNSVAVSLLEGGRGWSPNSQYLVVHVAERSGAMRFGVVNRSTHSVKLLPGTPPSLATDFDWLPNGRLIYATTAGRMYSSITADSFIQGSSDRWRATWKGLKPQVTISSANPEVTPSSEGPGTINIADPSTGQVLGVATGDYMSLRVSPDGHRLATVCLPRVPITRFVTGPMPAINHVGGDLCVFGILNNSLVLEARSTGIIVSADGLEWSPDGNRLLLTARRNDDDVYNPVVYLYESRDQRLTSIRAPDGYTYRDLGSARFSMASLPYGWIDRAPAIVLAKPSNRDDSEVISKKRGLSYAEYEGYRFDVWSFSSAEPVNLTSFSAASVMDFTMSREDDSGLVSTGGDTWRIHLGRAPSQVEHSSGAQVAVIHGANDTSEVEFVSADHREKKVLDRINTLLVHIDAGQRERFDYTVAGQRQTGWLIKPPRLEKGRRYPVIMLVYGGSLFDNDPPRFARLDERYPFVNGQIWAAKGFVVICPSLPVGAGADTDQSRALANATVASLEEVTRRGFIDPARVAILGHSFGGYTALSILMQASNLFRTGVVESGGFYDPIHAWGSEDAFDGLAGTPIESFGSVAFVEGGAIAAEGSTVEIPECIYQARPFFSRRSNQGSRNDHSRGP